jgi:hypothetical protein
MANFSPQFAEDLQLLQRSFDAAYQVERTARRESDYHHAHDGFWHVIDGTRDLLTIAEGPAVVPAMILRAAALREDGFTSIRNSLLIGDDRYMSLGMRTMREGWSSLETLAGEEVQTDHVNAEQLATIHSGLARIEGYTGRMVVARQVLNKVIVKGEAATPEHKQAQHWFGEANIRARDLAKDPKVIVENAMYGARTERVNNSPFEFRGHNMPSELYIGKWGVRALQQIVRGDISREDRKACLETFRAVLPQTMWRPYAMASAIGHNRV